MPSCRPIGLHRRPKPQPDLLIRADQGTRYEVLAESCRRRRDRVWARSFRHRAQEQLTTPDRQTVSNRQTQRRTADRLGRLPLPESQRPSASSVLRPQHQPPGIENCPQLPARTTTAVRHPLKDAKSDHCAVPQRPGAAALSGTYRELQFCVEMITSATTTTAKSRRYNCSCYEPGGAEHYKLR